MIICLNKIYIFLEDKGETKYARVRLGDQVYSKSHTHLWEAYNELMKELAEDYILEKGYEIFMDKE